MVKVRGAMYRTGHVQLTSACAHHVERLGRLNYLHDCISLLCLTVSAKC